MVKKLPDIEKKGQKKFQKNNLKDWTKWNSKVGGRSFHITSGAFKDTLLCRPLSGEYTALDFLTKTAYFSSFH